MGEIFTHQILGWIISVYGLYVHFIICFKFMVKLLDTVSNSEITSFSELIAPCLLAIGGMSRSNGDAPIWPNNDIILINSQNLDLHQGIQNSQFSVIFPLPPCCLIFR